MECTGKAFYVEKPRGGVSARWLLAVVVLACMAPPPHRESVTMMNFAANMFSKTAQFSFSTNNLELRHLCVSVFFFLLDPELHESAMS